MESLPLKLRKNSYEYTQLFRGSKSVLYEQRDEGPVVYYEVFLIRIKPGRKIKGKLIPAKEWFPNDEAGGTWLWTFRNLDEALWRFKELEAGKKKHQFTHLKTGKKVYG